MNLFKPAATIALLGSIGCGSGAPSAPANDVDPNYTFSLAGDLAGRQSGISMATYLANGWTEVTNNGATRFTSDVTLVLLASSDPKEPQTNIGLLGRPKVGTYRVRTMSDMGGGALEYYGRYRVSNADGTSTMYDATTGSVTITEVSSVVRGTFSFHCAYAVTWPAQMTVGTVARSVPASLDVAGSFVVKAPR